MNVHKWTDMRVTIGGVPLECTSASYEQHEGRTERAPLIGARYEATATIHLDAETSRPFFDMLDRAVRHAQLVDRLVRRLAYANRKGRRAARRLFAMGILEVNP